MNKPLPLLLTAFVTGLALSSRLSFKGDASLVLVTALLLWCVLFGLRYFRADTNPKKICLFLSWLLFLGLGYLYARPHSLEQGRPQELLSLADGRSLRLVGILQKTPVFLPDRTELVIGLEQCLTQNEVRPVKGRVLVYLWDRPQVQMACGDRVLWLGSLRPVVNFKNPGAFDFENYMSLKGIYFTSWVSNPELLVVIGRGRFFLPEFIENARLRVQTFLDSHASPMAASLYKALIIGERRYIPGEIKEAFTRAGVNHILAISGLHMGMIALVAYTLVSWCVKRFPYLLLRFSAFKIAALFSIPVVLFYGVLAGMSPPSVRAMIMVLVFLAATFLDRQWDIYNDLAIAVWVILLFSPRTLYTPSFQLSVMAVVSIALLYPLWLNWIDRRRSDPLAKLRPRPLPVVDKLRKMILISAIAILGTAPLVVYHFQRLSLVGLFSNVIVIPLIGMLALPLGLIATVLLPFSMALADLFLQAGSVVLLGAVKAINFFAAWPVAAIGVIRPDIWEVFLFYAGVLLMAMTWRHRAFKWCGLICLSVIFVVEMASAYQRTNSNALKVTFLDVGQGSATFVQFPGGKNMIIDGGGTLSGQFDIGERVVAPFLRTAKVRSIDYVVLTHPHPDHVGGLAFLLGNFNVKEIWTNGDRVETEAFASWQQSISGRGIPCRELNIDGHYRFNINGVIIDVYGPVGAIRTSGLRDVLLNRRSLVVRLSYGRRHFLIPGDIDASREGELWQKGCTLKSDVLLSPHHGSNASNSEGFIRAVAPQTVIFSAGRFNRFFFPHRNVLRRFGAMGCSIYRTDRDGAITCLTDGRFLQIKRHAS